MRVRTHRGVTITGRRSVRYRNISNDAEPEPRMTAACSTAVGTGPSNRICPTSARERRYGESRCSGGTRPPRYTIPHACLGGGTGEVPRRCPVLGFERRSRADGVDQVVGDIDAEQRRAGGGGVRRVRHDDLDLLPPGGVAQAVRRAGHAAHRVALGEQVRHQAATDVAGRAGDQAPQRFHVRQCAAGADGAPGESSRVSRSGRAPIGRRETWRCPPTAPPSG